MDGKAINVNRHVQQLTCLVARGKVHYHEMEVCHMSSQFKRIMDRLKGS